MPGMGKAERGTSHNHTRNPRLPVIHASVIHSCRFPQCVHTTSFIIRVASSINYMAHLAGSSGDLRHIL